MYAIAIGLDRVFIINTVENCIWEPMDKRSPSIAMNHTGARQWVVWLVGQDGILRAGW